MFLRIVMEQMKAEAVRDLAENARDLQALGTGQGRYAGLSELEGFIGSLSQMELGEDEEGGNNGEGDDVPTGE